MKNNFRKLIVNVTGRDLDNVVEKIIELHDEHNYNEEEIAAMTIYIAGVLSAKAGLIIDSKTSIGECLPAFMYGYNLVKQAEAY